MTRNQLRVAIECHKGGESESGQMVLKKVKWTYFDAYLCQTMWNIAKKINEKAQTAKFTVFARGSQLRGAKNLEN